ncbi:MAG: polyphosphate kinase 2 family protein [Cryomorphaceae bacterium]|nr:polyphosphate kinase 2 family protein [Cryomorphaceae bacterium]
MNHPASHRFDGSKKFVQSENPSEPKEKMKSKEADVIIAENAKWLDGYQERLFASGERSVLIVLQAMDAAGKDGTLRRLITGVNPQGIIVTSFKRPTPEEVNHDFLWRVQKALPQKGYIGVFNRSHYEEVLVTRVHPEFILAQKNPGVGSKDGNIVLPKDFWKNRFAAIRAFEKHLADSGTIIIKFFLNVSKEEQKKRLIDRMVTPEKNWKFNITDIKERQHWKEYMSAYEEMINETACDHAPWYVIPADDKDNMRALVSIAVRDVLSKFPVDYPDAVATIEQELKEAEVLLKMED